MNKYCLLGVLVASMILMSCTQQPTVITKTRCRDTVVTISRERLFFPPETLISQKQMCRDTVIILDYREVSQ